MEQYSTLPPEGVYACKQLISSQMPKKVSLFWCLETTLFSPAQLFKHNSPNFVSSDFCTFARLNKRNNIHLSRTENGFKNNKHPLEEENIEFPVYFLRASRHALQGEEKAASSISSFFLASISHLACPPLPPPPIFVACSLTFSLSLQPPFVISTSSVTQCLR